MLDQYSSLGKQITKGVVNLCYNCRFCLSDSLDKTLVKGKIVLCDNWVDGEEPFLAGAAGVIMQDVYPHDVADNFPLPASYLRVDDATRVLSYTRNLSRY